MSNYKKGNLFSTFQKEWKVAAKRFLTPSHYDIAQFPPSMLCCSFIICQKPILIWTECIPKQNIYSWNNNNRKRNHHMLPFCFGVCLYLKEIIHIPLYWGPLINRQISLFLSLPSSQTQAHCAGCIYQEGWEIEINAFNREIGCSWRFQHLPSH